MDKEGVEAPVLPWLSATVPSPQPARRGWGRAASQRYKITGGRQDSYSALRAVVLKLWVEGPFHRGRTADNVSIRYLQYDS